MIQIFCRRRCGYAQKLSPNIRPLPELLSELLLIKFIQSQTLTEVIRQQTSSFNIEETSKLVLQI